MNLFALLLLSTTLWADEPIPVPTPSYTPTPETWPFPTYVYTPVTATQPARVTWSDGRVAELLLQGPILAKSTRPVQFSLFSCGTPSRVPICELEAQKTIGALSLIWKVHPSAAKIGQRVKAVIHGGDLCDPFKPGGFSFPLIAGGAIEDIAETFIDQTAQLPADLHPKVTLRCDDFSIFPSARSGNGMSWERMDVERTSTNLETRSAENRLTESYRGVRWEPAGGAEIPGRAMKWTKTQGAETADLYMGTSGLSLFSFFSIRWTLHDTDPQTGQSCSRVMQRGDAQSELRALEEKFNTLPTSSTLHAPQFLEPVAALMLDNLRACKKTAPDGSVQAFPTEVE